MGTFRKFIIVLSVFALLVLISCGDGGDDEDSYNSWSPVIPTDFVYVTPFGIEISASQKAMNQFEAEYGYTFEEVDWNRIDEFFFLIAKYHGLAEEVTVVKQDPDNLSYTSTTERKLYVSTQLRIIIQEWDPSCVDEIPGSREMKVFLPGWGLVCIDGVFIYNVSWPAARHNIMIHLGDDGGVGFDSFCLTAIDWELHHYMLYALGDPCWYDESSPGCIAKRPSGRTLGLCDAPEPTTLKVAVAEMVQTSDSVIPQSNSLRDCRVFIVEEVEGSEGFFYEQQIRIEQ